MMPGNIVAQLASIVDAHAAYGIEGGCIQELPNTDQNYAKQSQDKVGGNTTPLSSETQIVANDAKLEDFDIDSQLLSNFPILSASTTQQPFQRTMAALLETLGELVYVPIKETLDA